MATQLSDGTGNPADYLKYKTAVDSLIESILRSKTGVSDFFTLLSPQRDWASAHLLISNSVKFNNDASVKIFFSQLALHHSSCTSDQMWWEMLGEIVESTVYALLVLKYGKNVKQEKSADVYVGEDTLASTEGKTLDCIYWDLCKDCGEMHEVKKNVSTSIPRNRHRMSKKHRDFKQKLYILSSFKFEVENRTKRQSFIGISNLLNTTAQTRRIVLSTYPDLRINFLGRDEVVQWIGQKYTS